MRKEKFQNLVYIAFIISFLAACDNKKPDKFERPMDLWAFRPVLDKQPPGLFGNTHPYAIFLNCLREIVKLIKICF